MIMPRCIGYFVPLVPAKAGTQLLRPALDTRLRENERKPANVIRSCSRVGK
jgi:hypothetical protein